MAGCGSCYTERVPELERRLSFRHKLPSNGCNVSRALPDWIISPLGLPETRRHLFIDPRTLASLPAVA